MPQKIVRSPLTLLNLLLFLSFGLLTGLWLIIKINLANNLNPSLTYLAYIDIIRSHASVDLALCGIFAANFKIGLYIENSYRKLSAALTFFLYLLVVFYFLKLTGLYAYTHDATPYSMIVYGTYLLGLPFAGEALSFLGFIFLPCSLIASLLVIFFINIRHSNYLQKKQRARYHVSVIFIITLLFVSIVPPIQKDLPLSLAYHPYIYSAFASQSIHTHKSEKAEYQPIENNVEKNQQINKAQKNIVIVVLESFGKEALQENITPILYDLKKTSLVFENAFAVIPHTSKALVTIHCGDMPFLSPYLLESNLGVTNDCLAHTLSKQNYESVFFQSVTEFFENRQALVKNLGFNEFIPLEAMDKKNFEAVNYFGYEDDIMLPKSEEWLLTRNLQKPFLASYLTGTSHHNYYTPSNFPQQHFVSQKNKNRYLNAAHYVDRFVGKLLQQYKSLGLYENTIFVFVGDHGEGFGDHRPLMHNNNLYNSGLHIPLIIHEGSSQKIPKSIEKLTSQSEITHILKKLLNNEHLSIDNNKKSIFSSCWYPNYCYSLIEQNGALNYKYILDIANKTQALYELSADPQERKNLFDIHPELSHDLNNKLFEKLTKHNQRYDAYYKDKHQNYMRLKADSFSPFQSVEY